MRQALQIAPNGTTTDLDLDAPEGSYSVLRRAVEGLIQPVGFDGFDMYVNEEFLYNGSQVNIAATRLYSQAYGPSNYIMGTVVLVGPLNRSGDSTGLPDAVRERALRLAGIASTLAPLIGVR